MSTLTAEELAGCPISKDWTPSQVRTELERLAGCKPFPEFDSDEVQVIAATIASLEAKVADKEAEIVRVIGYGTDLAEELRGTIREQAQRIAALEKQDAFPVAMAAMNWAMADSYTAAQSALNALRLEVIRWHSGLLATTETPNA